MKFVLHVGADSFLYELVAFTQCALLFCNIISKTEHIFDVYLSINQDECTNIISIPFNIDLKRHRFIREINSLADQSQSPWPHSKNNTHNYLFFFISNTKKRALDLKVRLLDV